MADTFIAPLKYRCAGLLVYWCIVVQVYTSDASGHDLRNGANKQGCGQPMQQAYAATMPCPYKTAGIRIYAKAEKQTGGVMHRHSYKPTMIKTYRKMNKETFVAFATQKGGVGKSTVTALVAN